jgi:hypothetical protein
MDEMDKDRLGFILGFNHRIAYNTNVYYGVFAPS